MRPPSLWHAISVVLLCGAALAQKSSPCVNTEAAAASEGKNICLAAHVYNIAELDGTRFLDLCTPETSDDDCHFFVASFASDRDAVGDLAALRDTDIQIRGTVQLYQGRTMMVLNRRQQLHGGNEKFVPNPQLTGEAFAGRNREHDRARWPESERFSHVSSTRGKSEMEPGSAAPAATAK